MEKGGEHIRYKIEKGASIDSSFSFSITFLMIKYQTGMETIHPKNENIRMPVRSRIVFEFPNSH
jgi:hypothetical protein